MTSPDSRPLHSNQVQLVGIRKASQAGVVLLSILLMATKEVSSVLVTVDSTYSAAAAVVTRTGLFCMSKETQFFYTLSRPPSVLPDLPAFHSFSMLFRLLDHRF